MKNLLNDILKRLVTFLFSTQLMMILLLVFAVAIGVATFIENSQDVITSKLLIYNALWFEFVYVLMIVNFIGIVKRFNLFSLRRAPGFIMHIAFVVIILGAAVTRYLGFEGTMHIREGESSNLIYSDVPHLQILVEDNTNEYSYDLPLQLSEIVDNSFNANIKTEGNGVVKVAYKNFIKNEEPRGADNLILDINYNGKHHEVSVFGGAGFTVDFQEVELDGIKLKVRYGNKSIEIPFSIGLNDFQLERYPGSMSPSSFASEVTLMDSRNGLSERHRIFMNNVLDYDGYRFFQSSYDQDEQGTVLSVNHDFYGTWLSYIGYLLMGVGFILILISPNARFIFLRRTIREIRLERKNFGLILVFVVGFNGFAFSQNEKQNTLSKEHAAKFGHLINQSYGGRFEPLHSLATNVMHKIAKKDNFATLEKGELNAMQVFMEMFLNSDYWKAQKLIYVSEKTVQDLIGIEGKYASFNDFFEEEHHNENHESGEQDAHSHSVYKLTKFAEQAFRKMQSEQNKFDKEIIKVDERLNLCIMVFQGSMFKIFPEQGSPTNQWVSWDENSAMIPLTGTVSIINNDLQLQNFNYNNILRAYFTELYNATHSNNYDRAEKLLGYLHGIQRNSDASSILPTEKMVDFEISYNESQIFVKLKYFYGLLAVFLMLFAFIENLRWKKSNIISWGLKIGIFLLGLGFIYHTYGMGVRWYLTNHAPWSNGYEALLLVAWGSLLAGFCFVQNSKITLAITVLLAFLMLMTAGHSSYDPQLTNLQPVLKSFWLIIHVAVITISYGFLGLGFLLGLTNLILYLLRTNKKPNRLDLLITELTYINEISLVVGLILVTCGTFLGGIWANESWGRYWGWDAKETWSLVMVVAYTMILHFRLVPALQGRFMFNVGSILGFGTIIMTFIGVNYYLSKGLHSYASGDTPIFPMWAWMLIIVIVSLIFSVAIKRRITTK